MQRTSAWFVLATMALVLLVSLSAPAGQERNRDIPGGPIPTIMKSGGSLLNGMGGQNTEFEPNVYVDDSWVGTTIGSDPDGTGPASAFGTDAFDTIQEGIDAVSPGGTVNVYPGDYSEIAAGRYVLGTNGPHQFGLFIGTDKEGITVQGVDAGGFPIIDYTAVGANVETNATNNFGYSGVFVEADHVTMTGLKILNNKAPYWDNKTFEIIGDDLTVKYCWFHIFDWGGSLYFNDWRFDMGMDTSHVQSYHIEGNLFDWGTSIDLASGAGFSGPVAGRNIINNSFKPADPSYAQYWNYISFNGSGTGVPWFLYSVGGAIITGNTFDAQTTQYIRARGDYDNSQFDWASYWNDNTFGTSVVVGAAPPGDLREWSYTSAPYVFNHVRHISGIIQEEIGHATDGDIVLVGPGTYYESPNITTSLTLKSSQGRDVTNVMLQTTPTYLGGLTVGAADVTVEGFTITGFDGTPTTLASSNIVVTTAARNVSITSNTFLVGNLSSSSNGDDGMGMITYYNTTPPLIDSLKVTMNIFQPLNTDAGRSFYVNPGVNYFLFTSNTVNPGMGRGGIQAMNSLIEGNVVTGSGDPGSRKGGMFTWGYPDPTVWGNATFTNNTFSNCYSAIAIYDANANVVIDNTFDANDYGILMQSFYGFPTFDPTTSDVHYNSFTNSTLAAIQNDVTAYLDATCNYYGSATGPTHSSNPGGTGDVVSDYVTYDPWSPDATPYFSIDLGAEDQYIYSPYTTSLTLSPAIMGCGAAPFTYVWSPGGATTPALTVTTAGVYSVTVTDANGTTAYDEVNVLVLTVPTCGGKNKFYMNHYGKKICVSRSSVPDHLAHGDTFWGLPKDGFEEIEEEILPETFSLSQNYPNPFNPKTSIGYDVPEPALVTITLYNTLGQEIATLVNASKEPGRYQVEFDGSKLGSGLYYYRMQAGRFHDVKKLMHVK